MIRRHIWKQGPAAVMAVTLAFAGILGMTGLQCGEYGKRKRRFGAQFRISKRRFRRKFRKRRYGAVS